jgi:hypothetical protein
LEFRQRLRETLRCRHRAWYPSNFPLATAMQRFIVYHQYTSIARKILPGIRSCIIAESCNNRSLTNRMQVQKSLWKIFFVDVYCRNGGRTFCRKTFCRTDILPTDILPNGRFAERTFCRTDSLTNGQLAENRDIFWTLKVRLHGQSFCD